MILIKVYNIDNIKYIFINNIFKDITDILVL